ncbi:MAG: DUF3368 domain-containing protein [Bacteroidales bacterium]|nr:DUF3368 domain-containing protein [Bacteroidales bacterium]
MPKTIIADTSCFIILNKIKRLDILRQLYGSVTTTNEVIQEYKKGLPDWIIIQSAGDVSRQQLLEMQIDKGEASAIALALEVSDSIVILDDNKARRIAEKLALNVTGTIGIIIKAKHSGLIRSIKPYLEKIKETDFRMSPELENQALKEAEEF